MNISLSRWSAIALVIGLFTLLSSGCVTGGGYADGVGIGVDYYEPYRPDYGGWGPGYRVAPFRGGDHGPGHGDFHPAGHAYRSAPPTHSIPSIPSHSRSGGGRSR
jgi:hypothetical protein